MIIRPCVNRLPVYDRSPVYRLAVLSLAVMVMCPM